MQTHKCLHRALRANNGSNCLMYFVQKELRLILFLAFSWLASGWVYAQTNSVPLRSPEEVGPSHPGTRAMANLLKRSQQQLNVGTNPYASTARAEYLAQQLNETDDPSDKLRLQFEFGKELLNAGYYEQANKAMLNVFSVLYKNREHIERETLIESW
ncbi:MAG: hypothetical protein F6K19_50765, partial [Cyanothece sp. SIO1E1]|nr:hypothetical protein [Cyanothece sp. SIO1E1]